MNKVATKYLKHIIKNAFGNVGLRKLKITPISDIMIHSNLYYIGGFYVKIAVSVKELNATVLFYDYFGDHHSYLKNKTVSSITSILSNKGKYYYSKYWTDNFKLFDRVFSLPYSKELLSNYYEFVNIVNDNLNYGNTYYYGDGYGKNRVEFRYSQGSINIVQGDCKISLDNLMTYDKHEIIEKINSLRELKLEGVNFEISKKK